MAELRSLSIRMYKGVLGDCLLLRPTLIERGQEVTRNILIDCGVLQNVPSGQNLIAKLDSSVVNAVGRERLAAVVSGDDQIAAIAGDLRRELNGRIDLLVITHEHFDHLSGFAVRNGGFLTEDLKIDRLWFAWTENPKDPQARSLRARFDKGKRALEDAMKLLTESGAHKPVALKNVESLAAFAGVAPLKGPAASPRITTSGILEMLKAKAGPAAISYLEPGQVIDLDEFGLTAFVLGPPRLETLLKKDGPSSGAKKEVYLTSLDAAETAHNALSAKLASQKEPDNDASTERLYPFNVAHGQPIRRRKQVKKRTSQKISPPYPTKSLYNASAAAWRRIDHDWTSSVEALALKMDSDTNNTSLALAFELPDGQVLLFPGDAQVGNWMSWNNQTYERKSGSGHSPVSAEELLRRVTFYKVGHHGSHNATLKSLGLERMLDSRLVAAIPVVEAVAAVQGKGRAEPGRGWKMPYGLLYEELHRRTAGRIVRGDGNPLQEQECFRNSPTDVNRPVTVSHAELWVEVTYDLDPTQ